MTFSPPQASKYEEKGITKSQRLMETLGSAQDGQSARSSDKNADGRPTLNLWILM